MDRLDIFHTILYISIIFWFLPLFKQKGTFYFGYFVVLALGEPAVAIMYNMVRINSTFYMLLLLCISIGFLQPKEKILKTIAVGIMMTSIVYLTIQNVQIINIIAAFSILVMIYFILIHFFEYYLHGKLNLFLILLIFYNLINLFKFVMIIVGKSGGVVGFSLGTAFQMLFGLVFSFVNINTKNYSIRGGSL